MKYPTYFTVLMVICLSGCYGPRFNVRAPTNTQRAGNDSSMADALFTPIASTNQIEVAWLTPPKDLYRLGPGDVIEIETIGEAGPMALANVGPDGKIYYSLLPGMFVWGLTLTETKNLLEQGLAKYLRFPPEISVTLRNVSSKTVWMLGNLQRPGVYPLATPMTLLEAITMAGGTLNMPGTPDGICDLSRSFVMRDGNLITVDFERLLRTGDFSQNIYLQPGDFVYLRSGLTRSVYVLGAVGSPRVVSYTDQMTLISAVMSCGGTQPYAHLSQVAIIRGSLSNPRIGVIDMKPIRRGSATDVKLQPGDIVYIPFVPWKKVAMFAENILGTFVTTIAVNEGTRAVISRAGPISFTLPLGGSGSQIPSVPYNPGNPYIQNSPYNPGTPFNLP